MTELKMDDFVTITIRARVYDVLEDRSERGDRLSVLKYSGKTYWLVTDPGDVVIVKRVTDERVEEILSGLNGFVVHEYEPVSDLVNGRAVHTREIVGSDFNIQQAMDWASNLPEVVDVRNNDDDGEAEVELYDGTVLVWEPDRAQWAVTVSDDTESEVLR